MHGRIKKSVIIFFFLALLGICTGYFALYMPNIYIIKSEQPITIFARKGDTFAQIIDSLMDKNAIKNHTTLHFVSQIFSMTKRQIIPGKYVIKNTLSNKALITKFRSGEHEPINVVINNVRDIYGLAGKISHYMAYDSTAYLTYWLQDTVWKKYDVSKDKILTLFIPNTYQFFWHTSPQKFTQRMAEEHKNYWTKERLTKLASNNLSPSDAYILASIVEKESNFNPEKPTIAGVYINRLKSGEKLQADPTVVYAVGDFNLRRVLYEHLTYDSPYNTYIYNGLPPGPICMPSLSSLESVINAETHDYMFFCATPDNSGKHAFAVTYGDHLKNARAFSQWLDQNKIK